MSTDGNLTVSSEREVIRVFNYILYSMIIVIGVPGNVLLVWCLTAVRKEKVNKSYKILVVSLAINDILLLLFCLVTIAELATDSFPFGSVMCVILWPVQTAFYGAGVFNMVALNVHRYYVIAFSGSRYIDAITVFIMILCWLIPALITAVPYAIYLQLEEVDGVPECRETWSDNSTKRFTVYLFLIQYVLPLLTIASLNALTIKRLNKGQLFRESCAKMSHDNYGAHRRIVKMLILIVFIFFLFGLPGQVIWLMGVRQDNPYFELLDIFPYMYCVLNPVLFFNYNKECHDLLWKFLSTVLCCKHWHRNMRKSSRSALSEPNSTLLGCPRVSESQETSHSDRPRSDLFTSVVPKYLLEQETQLVPEEDKDLKPCNGLVANGVFPTYNSFSKSELDFREHSLSDVKQTSPPLVGAGTMDQQLFRGSFVELLKTRHINDDLIRRLEASPETAIIEEGVAMYEPRSTSTVSDRSTSPQS